MSIPLWHYTPPTYIRNNISQKCEGNCGVLVLNEIVKRIYPESLKKIMGAFWELPAKWHSQSRKEFCNRGRGLSAAILRRLQATPPLQTSLNVVPSIFMKF